MYKTMEVADVLYHAYKERYHVYVDEMKMHKLMYFLQRESLMTYGVPLFDEDFRGWKFGPVLKSVRSEYRLEHPFSNGCSTKLSSNDMLLVNSVLDRYGVLNPWQLSRLSHDEFSWKRARSGLRGTENGDVVLKLNDMKLDAAREKSVRRLVSENV